MIEARGLTVDRGERTVLEGVDLIGAGGLVTGVVGPNASGKSTLLATLYRSLVPRAGTVVVGEEDVARISRRRIAALVSVVLQNTEEADAATVLDVVRLGRLPHRPLVGMPAGPTARAHDETVCRAALERVGAGHLTDRPICAVSGGERQRVLIARALAQEATHLLLDEPTNHLDVRHQYEVLALVRELGTTAVVVLHDLNLAARFCDRVVLLSHGRVHSHGTPADVFTPEAIAEVYGMAVTVLDLGERPHLVFENPIPSTPRKAMSP